MHTCAVLGSGMMPLRSCCITMHLQADTGLAKGSACTPSASHYSVPPLSGLVLLQNQYAICWHSQVSSSSSGKAATTLIFLLLYLITCVLYRSKHMVASINVDAAFARVQQLLPIEWHQVLDLTASQTCNLCIIPMQTFSASEFSPPPSLGLFC